MLVKKFSVVLIFAILFMLIMSGIAMADIVASGSCGADLTWTLDSEGLLAITGTGKMTDYHESDSVPWYSNRSNIKSLVIGHNVTTIGNLAFDSCDNLTSVNIPSSISSIGDSAFSGSGLISVNIPDGVSSIGKEAFSCCHNLTSVTIPNSVTDLGSGAFSWCSSLTSVNIPNSITSINDAFYSSGLTSITIPDGVIDIGQGAFQDCNSLTCVIIPDSVTSIGDYAFNGCYSLTSVNIPDSVISIGEHAFAWCTSLSSMTMGNSVTSIGIGAFLQCDNLTNVTIGKNVTSIGKAAFRNCSSLINVYIPVSVISIEQYAFQFCGPIDVYYGGTAEQWDRIDIAFPGYNSFETIHYNSIDPDSDLISIPKEKYGIFVVDKDGKPLPGVTVTYNSLNETTDSKGLVCFPRYTVGYPLITVSLEGYVTWSNADSNWIKSNDGYSTIVLYPLGEGEYKLATATYSTVDGNFSADVLTRTKTLHLKNSGNLVGDWSTGNFDLSCRAMQPGMVDHYELWQNGNRIEGSENGLFHDLSVTRFVKGGGCFVRVVGKGGQAIDTRINLQFAESKANSATQLNFSTKDASFAIGDDVPFLGGSTITASLPIKSPATASVSGDKVQVGLNLQLAGKTQEERIKEFSKQLSNLKRAGSYDVLNKHDLNKLKSFVKDQNTLTLWKNVQLDFAGYVESDKSSNTGKGQIMFIFKADLLNAEYNTVVYIVPVTVQFKASLEGQAIANITFDYANATIITCLDLETEFKFNAFMGFGTGDIVGVGVYGEADLDLLFQLFGTQPSGLKKADLTGELGIKGYIAFLEYTQAFAYQTWHLYTANSVGNKYLGDGAPVAYEEAWNEGMMYAGNYYPSDISYLYNESPWQGGGSLMRSYDSARTQLTALLSETYRNARPVMVAGSDGLYAAFVRADVENGARYVVCTRFDGYTWSVPVAADANAILDDDPSLYVDSNGTVWLAYARTTGRFGDSLVSYAQQQEIVVGYLDPEDLSFNQAAVYGGDGFAAQPNLYTVNGQPVLAWTESTVTDENSVIYPVDADICYASCSGGVWSEASVMCSLDEHIKSITPGLHGGSFSIAYLTEDKELYCVDINGSSELLAEGVTGRVRFAKLPGTTAADYLWNGVNSIQTAGGMTVEVDGISHEYAVVGDRIYYSMPLDNNANLSVLQYQDGDWSMPITLTEEETYLENLSVADFNGRDYVFGMATSVTITENEVNDYKDLVWSAVMPVHDLILEDISYDHDPLAAGEDVVLTLTMTNGGDDEVDSIDILIDGELKQTVRCDLKPGESMDVDISLVCPNGLTKYEFSADETGETDYYPRNNTIEVGIGYANAVLNMGYEQIGDQNILVMMITNEGVETASGSISIYDADGVLAKSIDFENLAAGDTTVVRYALPSDFEGIRGGDVSAAVVLGQEEWNEYDNEFILHINEVAGYSVIMDDHTNGAATVTGIVSGNTYSGETTFTVACDDACAVLCTTDGGETYTRLKGTAVDNGYSFTVDVTQDMTIIVALKGDVNLDGVLKNQDVTMAKAANLGKRTLSTLQEMVADVTGDGVFKNQDITKFKAALLGKTTLSWDL